MSVSLSTIETAINTIQTTGQSVSVEGMSYTAANINDLIELRKTLQNEEMRSNTSRPTFRKFSFTNMGY